MSACSSFSSYVCTASTTSDVYTITWADSLWHQATTLLYVANLAASFVVLPVKCTTILTSSCNFQGFAYDKGGNDITGSDAWGPGTMPTNVTCNMTRHQGTDIAVANCFASAVGTYAVPFTDTKGITFTATRVVGAVRHR